MHSLKHLAVAWCHTASNNGTACMQKLNKQSVVGAKILMNKDEFSGSILHHVM